MSVWYGTTAQKHIKLAYYVNKSVLALASCGTTFLMTSGFNFRSRKSREVSMLDMHRVAGNEIACICDVVSE